MGRFWEIGPQQTLFMPGCWLKKGKNEIIVLDLKGPTATKVAGLNRPIIDMLRNKNTETHRKKGQTLKLDMEIPVYKGVFTKNNGWQEVKFHKIMEGRYLCLNAISSFDGGKIASIAELDILDKSGNPISREEWEIKYADSEENLSGNHSADKIFDLQESTFWQTSDNIKFPHQIVIDMGEKHDISGFRMLPHAEKDISGLIKEFSIYVKKDAFKY